jgi:Flp pilus assembly protein TadD
LQDPNERIQRSLFKIAIWSLAILVVVIGGSVVGYKQYRAWQERRLVAQANALVNERNLKRASLDARRILQINPDSAEGCRIMARISEEAGLKGAVDWRRRVVELEPGKAGDVILLARAALQFDDKATLDLALKRLPEDAKNTADYHALAAELAGRRNDAAGMERHLREAVRLDPANRDVVLKLAAMELASRDDATRARGKQTLLALQNEATKRREATRRLVFDGLRRQRPDEALPFAQQLDSFPERMFDDRLLLLQSLHETADPGYAPLLQELQTAAATDAESAAQLISWLNSNKMPAAAIAWGTQLPPEMLSQRAVPVALSDSFIMAGDWAGMQRLVKTASWGAIDYVRHALAARAARELRDETESSAQWTAAIQKVTANPKQAQTLAEIVQKWGWRNEAIEALWLATKDPETGDGALQALYLHFAQTGATHDLYRVSMRQQELKPDDRDVQNNVAQLALLLNMNSERAQRTARDLYESEPKNPAYVSTYAFALQQAGDTKKALKILSDLPEEQLRDPAIAAYHGMILASSGDQARAEEFLDLGEKAALLPEERALLERARRTLARR